MSKADLHVHTKHSGHASEWFLKRIGAAESYVSPERIRELADQRGMDFFSVTDHNSIGAHAELKERYPERFIPGVETTTYFPEDLTKIHLLIYGLSESQFNEIQKIRKDIYDLRDYLKDQDLAHSVAHATYSINGSLKLEHLEKLILLFDVFEAINGGRNRLHNQTWTKILKELRPSDIDRLYRKYDIEPFGGDPWKKGFTGGSDDHGGIFTGKTWTVGEGDTVESYLDSIKGKRAFAEGRSNDFSGLAFTVYKVAYDYSCEKSAGIAGSPLSRLAGHIFEERQLSVMDRIRLGRFKSTRDPAMDAVKGSLGRLIDTLRSNGKRDIEEKLEIVYSRVTEMSDILLGQVAEDMERHAKNADVYKLVKDLSTTLYGVFLTVPFFTAFAHMYRNRDLIEELKARYSHIFTGGAKKVLWFTDNLNGGTNIAATLETIRRISGGSEGEIKVITSLGNSSGSGDLPPGTVDLPEVHTIKLPYCEPGNFRIPSVLSALKVIYEQDPDEIYISTPGPLGLTGLMAARLLGVRAIGIYGSDFALKADDHNGPEDLIRHMESCVNLFYSCMSRIWVPSREYIPLLTRKGLDPSRMEVIPRGIDTGKFLPAPHLSKENDQVKLLYAGEISRECNLDFLLAVFEEVKKHHERIHLTLAGDGPYLQTLRERYSGRPDIEFTGALPQQNLPEIYSSADLFVFPDRSDTFGMNVLEAQACGLPAVVPDTGGSREIVVHAQTGYIARSDDLNDWVNKVGLMLQINGQKPEHYLAMKRAARDLVVREYSWTDDLNAFMQRKARTGTDSGRSDVVEPAA